MRVPIACTLTVDDAATRIDEWRTVLGRSITSVRRTSPTEIVLLVRDDRAGLDELVGLAQREVACCGFFDFTLDIAVDAVALVVTVPPDAAGVLDEFAALAG
jgi:ribosomal protein S12 methylthiotransferase accessory factor YcaO